MLDSPGLWAMVMYVMPCSITMEYSLRVIESEMALCAAASLRLPLEKAQRERLHSLDVAHELFVLHHLSTAISLTS